MKKNVHPAQKPAMTFKKVGSLNDVAGKVRGPPGEEKKRLDTKTGTFLQGRKK